MDENKLIVLKENGYRIGPSCDLCRYGDFNKGQNFGDCLLHKYEHMKHTGDVRCLSIHRSGVCNKGFEACIVSTSALGTYTQFLRK